MAETTERDDEALPPGSIVGGYRVHGVLDRGGFGITYAVETPMTGRRYTLKEFFPVGLVRRGERGEMVVLGSYAETVAWALDTFERGVNALAGLRHPNLLEVQDYLAVNDTGYLLVNRVEGPTLLKWLKARATPPTLDEVRPLVVPIMEALGYLHGRGLIHRHVTPESILITDAGQPILFDFVAVSPDRTGATASDDERGIATRHYTAPDQLRARVRPTPQTDVYSMGAVLYRALTGVEPADGQDRLDQLVSGAADPYRPLTASRPATCSAGAAAAIDKALAVRPSERLASMAELQAAVEAPQRPRRGASSLVSFAVDALLSRVRRV